MGDVSKHQVPRRLGHGNQASPNRFRDGTTPCPPTLPGRARPGERTRTLSVQAIDEAAWREHDHDDRGTYAARRQPILTRRPAGPVDVIIDDVSGRFAQNTWYALREHGRRNLPAGTGRAAVDQFRRFKTSSRRRRADDALEP